MPLIEVILLGIVQGLTEFLPVSSTAHLAILPRLFGWPDPGLSYDIALHVGTLAAVLIYFFRDWVQVIGQGLGINAGGDPEIQRNRHLLWLLIIGTIPAAIAGLLFQKQAETSLRGPYVIAATMIVIGLFMWFAERIGTKKRDLSHISVIDSVVIGFAQAIAVIPGVSRSGITISAGLLRDVDRPSAARFSFLLSTPVILGAAAKDMWDLMKHEGGITPEMRTAFLLGILISAITGCATIAFFLNFLRRRSLNFFVGYRILFGIFIIAFAGFFR
ncbi:MAG: undecaprenyl-diphosphatase UppP [Bryobacterales bacterium]|nr:undecaprenyl-diphosphatase UppP [Bryobacterales bacterium]MBV9398503.1 undecaprenyl-diphosphatase UppP [Bryobacterales bacterium]